MIVVIHQLFKPLYFKMKIFKLAHNLDIEPIPVHPQLGGIETIKQKQNEIHNQQRINFERVGEFEYKAEVE